MRNWHGNLSPFGKWHGPRRGVDDLSQVLALLFSADEPGFLFLASPETCFTDTAGTTQAEPGDPVALWLDQSGNDNHATQATTANRPILGRKPEGGVTANSIGSGFDITEPGKPDRYYLFFGGSSDPRWMQTPVITPGTDKVQVFAGILSNGSGQIYNHATGTSVQNIVLSHNSAFYRGSGAFVTLSSGLSAPHSTVFSLITDLSGSFENNLRANGIVVDSSTNNAGGGNYGNYTPSIGQRNGDQFFEGEISALTTRFGPNLDANQIELVERFIATKVPEFTKPVIDGVPTIGVS